MATEAEERQRTRRGYWLRVARRRSGLTLKEVAQAMGYSMRSQTTIKLWEDGKRDPSDIQLTRIAEVYKIPAEVLFRPDPTIPPTSDHPVRLVGAGRARASSLIQLRTRSSRRSSSVLSLRGKAATGYSGEHGAESGADAGGDAHAAP